MLKNLKGYFFDREEFKANKRPVNILAGRSGYFEIRENEIGVFCAKAPVLPELPVITEGFQMKLPKIPYSLLGQILSLFRAYVGTENNEVMAQVYWWKSEQCYTVEVPNQRVTGALVDASLDTDIQLNPDLVQVLQIHSHNVMDAFWSTVDDRDETATMLYAVVGNLDQFYPTIRTRISVAGKFVEIPTEQVFESPFAESVHPDSWHDNVKIVKGGASLC